MTKFFGTVALVTIGALVIPPVAYALTLLGTGTVFVVVAAIVIARLLVWTVDR